MAPTARRRVSHRTRSRRLLLENLEERRVMATFVMDSHSSSMATYEAAAITSSAITDVGPVKTYHEDDPPVTLLGSETKVNDFAGFQDGSLRVLFRAGIGASDQLNIRNSGDGPGQISVSGEYVSFGGVIMGRRAGINAQELVVHFRHNTTTPFVQALLRAVTYENTNHTSMQSAVRQLKVELTNRFGRVHSLYRDLNLEAVNDAPRLQGTGAPIYVANTPIRLLYDVQVTDPDNQNFAGGQLTVHTSQGAAADDFLSLSGSFKFDGHNQLYRGSQIIGVRNAGGGKGTTDLVVDLNAHASPVGIAELLKALRFTARVAGPRELTFTLTDGSGGTSNTIFSRPKGPPVLQGGGTFGYSFSHGPVHIAPNAIVTDPKHANYDGASLLVYYSSGKDSNSRLYSDGNFVTNIDKNLLFYSDGSSVIVLGTITRRGLGAEALRIDFNAKATPELMQKFLREIKFIANLGGSSVQRVIKTRLEYADGSHSNTITTTINVS